MDKENVVPVEEVAAEVAETPIEEVAPAEEVAETPAEEVAPIEEVAETPEEEPVVPEEPADEVPELMYAGQSVIVYAVRTLGDNEIHHLTLADGSECDVSDEEYAAMVEASK